MTVYSGVIGGGKTISRPQVLSDSFERAAFVFKLNLALLMTAALLAIGYIFISNFLVSQTYTLDVRKKEFYQLSGKLAVQKEAENRNLGDALSFIQKSGMIEARDADPHVLDRGFALIK